MIKKSVCCSWYLRNHILYDCHLWYTCVKWWCLYGFFSFSQNFNSLGYQRGVGGGAKRAKNGPKWEEKELSHSISQELYLIWLWLLVNICKMMISPAIFFHFFKILIFQVFQSSSVNAKRKFWGVPHLLHMCVIFIIHAHFSRNLKTWDLKVSLSDLRCFRK